MIKRKYNLYNLLTAMVFAFSIVLIGEISEYSKTYFVIIAVLVLIFSVLLVYLYRNIIHLFLIFVFILYCNYSIIVGVYLYPELSPLFFNQISNEEIYAVGLICLFMCTLFTFLYVKSNLIMYSNSKLKDDNLFKSKLTNHFISYLCLAVYIVVFATQFSFGVNNTRAALTPLNEYRLIFLIISLCYSGNKKHLVIVWIPVILLTSVMTLIGGNRVDLVGPVIAYSLFWFYNKLNYKKIILMLVPLIILFTAIGVLRANFVLNSSTLSLAIQKLRTEKATFDTAIFAYFPALSSIEISRFISPNEKISLLMGHIGAIFTGYSDKSITLERVAREYYLHYSGYVSPLYFYFWFGYLGCFLYAMLIQFYTKLSLCKDNFRIKGLQSSLCLFFVSTVTRWYLYGIMNLFRNMFVFIVFYLFFYCIHLLIADNKVNFKKATLR